MNKLQVEVQNKILLIIRFIGYKRKAVMVSVGIYEVTVKYQLPHAPWYPQRFQSQD